MMVANLDQNPLKRAMISAWLPALLRQGTMFLIRVHGAHDVEERWLLPADTRQHSPIA